MSDHWFTHSDAGRSQSWRVTYSGYSKKGGDCVVRALAHVHDVGYDEAYDTTPIDAVIDTNEWLAAQGFERIPFPAVKGKKRMTRRDFCLQYRTGRYLLSEAHHLVAVIDGVAYDTFGGADRCVYSAWRLS